MQWIRWDEMQITGHTAMDHGHEKLVALINQLADAMETGKPKEFCSNTLDLFIEEIKTHFLAEEQLMDRKQFPSAEEHKALHAMLLKDVLAFKATYDAGESAEYMTLLVILDSWLKRDIMAADKALADYVAVVG